MMLRISTYYYDLTKCIVLWILFCITPNLSNSQNFDTLIDYSSLKDSTIKLPVINYFGIDSSFIAFGTYHTFNPTDTLLIEIYNVITQRRPELILYEGDNISFEAKSQSRTVEYYGEMGFVLYISDSLCIPYINIEPPVAEKFNYLKSKYNTIDIAIAILGMQITFWKHYNYNFENYFSIALDDLRNEGLLNDVNFNLEIFYDRYLDYFGHEFSYENFNHEDFQTKYERTVFNEINRDASKYRDRHMIELIINNLDARAILFVGGWHVIACKKAFNYIFNKK